jgi:hypothetical protein
MYLTGFLLKLKGYRGMAIPFLDEVRKLQGMAACFWHSCFFAARFYSPANHEI